MGFFHDRKLRKAVRAAMAPLERGAGLDAAPIADLDQDDRADAWALVADALMEGGAELEPIHAALDNALFADPDHWDAWAARAQVEQATEGREVEAIAALERLLALEPSADVVRADLTIMLLQTDAQERALSLLDGFEGLPEPDVGLRLGRALFGAGLSERAVALLGPLRKQCDQALRELSLAEAPARLRALHRALGEVHDEAYAELHGAEAVVVAPALDGELDGNAGVNYTLLGESLMRDAPPAAGPLRLEHPEQELDRAAALLERGEEAPARVLLGSAALRQGDAATAEDEFERACRADGRSFAAFLGLGAALEAQQINLVRRVEALGELPDSDDLPGLKQVVPDWPALTGLERQVVLASAAPLTPGLKLLAEAGAQIRLLPADVRPTDLPELSQHAGEVFEDDHRAFDALGGVATHKVACSRVLELLNIEAPRGWTFAHELAHLVFFVLSEAQQAPVLQLYEAGLEAGYVFDTYTVTDADEFFAGTYEDYLRQRFGCKEVKELDEDGILEATFAYFDDLGR